MHTLGHQIEPLMHAQQPRCPSRIGKRIWDGGGVSWRRLSNERIKADDKCAHRKLLLRWLMQWLQRKRLCRTPLLPLLPRSLRLNNNTCSKESNNGVFATSSYPKPPFDSCKHALCAACCSLGAFRMRYLRMPLYLRLLLHQLPERLHSARCTGLQQQNMPPEHS